MTFRRSGYRAGPVHSEERANRELRQWEKIYNPVRPLVLWG
jgi:transposase InsO family protein